ncbi:MetQ/NlpA family ABC transporter substrate-binding protein [Chlamydia buteonis]|uniref:ABC transporter substrate-binding protein n=1 Tax=Chlamydia buteonis TaxID=2494525 RepID=A0ABX8L9H8_9CHLA|nr:MetQ/NlpA family ABC transporter substrate-binding protein [Chlamydia buteonis]QXE27091.1 ABC transporter substrate-binding protein [Chlamydia buteonis]QXE27977.1 ABC transporter substrate-binding protein [Chlamydia buteonis]
MKKIKILSLLALAISLTGCRKNSEEVLRIAASPTPHAELLYSLEKEAKSLGLQFKILPIDDYRVPNRLLLDKQIDANYFQHEDFLKDECARYQCEGKLVVLAKVHLEPMGLYSSKIQSLEELKVKEQLRIAVPIDRTNEQRALDLLQDCNLISYKEASHLDITAKDVFGCGGKKVTIIEIAAPLLVSSLPDVDAAVIPGNFATAGGIYPYKNSLYLEDVHASKYTNVVVIRAEDMDDSRMHKLQQLLQGSSVKDFFDAKYKGIFLLQ